MPAHSLLFSKSSKGAARLNVPIRRTNRYQQCHMPSQHTYCGRVWNLIHRTVMYNLTIRKCRPYISTPPSLEVENFQMKIYYPAWNRTPDLLNQRQTRYHLSQRGELMLKSCSCSCTTSALMSKTTLDEDLKDVVVTWLNSQAVTWYDEGIHHGCANHATEGETLQSPIHCCDVTKPPYLFSGELWTSSLHYKRLFVYTVCCRRWVSASPCSEHVIQTSY